MLVTFSERILLLNGPNDRNISFIDDHDILSFEVYELNPAPKTKVRLGRSWDSCLCSYVLDMDSNPYDLMRRNISKRRENFISRMMSRRYDCDYPLQRLP